jgi:hypothetical protein
VKNNFILFSLKIVLRHPELFTLIKTRMVLEIKKMMG